MQTILPHAREDNGQRPPTVNFGNRSKEHIDSRAAGILGRILIGLDLDGDNLTDSNDLSILDNNLQFSKIVVKP